MITIGIIGNGFVGKATNQFNCNEINILTYDIDSSLCNPIGTTLKDLLICNSIFVSVPTPMNNDGSCYLKIVENVINNLNNLNYKGFIILRSTVPVGTCDRLNCFFMPEFLTEVSYINDFINNPDWIFGMLDNNNDFIEFITELINMAFKNKCIKYNNIHFTSNSEAEMIKMFRNCYLANKISFCNEIYQYCSKVNVNYNTVKELVVKDKRIGSSHTNVPGHDGKKGYGGTCFPKDTTSMKYEMEKVGVKPYILSAMKKRNEKIDRPEKDWKNDEGRSVVKISD